ncbi:SpaH/EbpB family LPXTG-anchored major pilin [Coprococcus comes]|uniref:SpaH/EbpB family LPXTG-anchored major pilin n=1 Tax=Coprococcus comes TaxID=410072 RepID=UPI001897F1CA|nr:SpaH/EbpB family LPXTG-anchored major pilin [Coprococcus comes]
MKKMRKIFAVLLTLAMVLGMSMTTFAAQITENYKNTITVNNLAEGVATNVSLANIIYLNDNNGNQEWTVVDWANAYIEVDTATGNYKIKKGQETALRDAAKNHTTSEFSYTGENAVTGTSCTFNNVPIGAYVVVADDTAGVYGLMVTNTYDRDGNVYMASQAANVTAKLEKYNVNKTASDRFVHRGQTVNFTVTTQMAPKSNEERETLTQFKVVDTSTGLKSDSFNLTKITIAGVEKTVDSNKVTTTTENGKTVFTVDLSEFISATSAGATVKVEYSAVVEDDHTYNNTATVNADTVLYEGGTVTGYEGNVSLKKVNTKAEVLNGAEFQLLKGTTPVSVVKVAAGVYKVALDNETNATTTLVATNGTLQVTGLDEGSYAFKETKAPEGYKVSPNNKEFTITANESAEVTVDELSFVNTKLSALPSTGGIGTTIFTIAGCVIMIAAAGLFFASRKKSDNK